MMNQRGLGHHAPKPRIDLDAPGDDLVDHEEEQRRQRRHRQHAERGRDQSPCRVGQVTLASSCRTSRMNWAGETFAIIDPSLLPVDRVRPPRGWQEWRGSNPQPPVLETGALPVELHS